MFNMYITKLYLYHKFNMYVPNVVLDYIDCISTKNFIV